MAKTGLPSGQGGSGAGVARFLANAGAYNQPAFVPQFYSPGNRYVPTRNGANNAAPAVAAASGAPGAPMGPVMGQPNINAPVNSYEWWSAYNPGADYQRHIGGEGR